MTDFTEADVTAEVERAAWDAWNKAPDTPGRMARAIAAATNAMRDRWLDELANEAEIGGLATSLEGRRMVARWLRSKRGGGDQ